MLLPFLPSYCLNSYSEVILITIPFFITDLSPFGKADALNSGFSRFYANVSYQIREFLPFFVFILQTKIWLGLEYLIGFVTKRSLNSELKPIKFCHVENIFYLPRSHVGASLPLC
jgi:hypothetical protein